MTVARVDRGFTAAGGGLALVGLVLAAVGGAAGAPGTELANSYYFAWLSWTALTFGFFGLSLLHHATRGHWGFPLVRLFEAGGGPLALGLSALGFVPLALMAPSVYPWANPSIVSGDPILLHRAPFMNFGFWAARAAVIFGVFIFFAWQNQQTLRQEELSGRPNWQARSRFSAVGIVVFFLLSTLAWTDWGMSRELHWYSTMYGFWHAIGSALMAMSLSVAIVCSQGAHKPYNKVVEPWITRDWGNLLLTMTLLWAYFSFSQYLITWSGNLPVFTEYFKVRTDKGWSVLSNTLLITQFFLPFLLLLMPVNKRQTQALAGIAGWIFVNRFFDWFWVSVPTQRPQIGVTALDLGLLLLLGGLWCLQFGTALKRAPLVTSREARLQEATDHA